MAEPSVSQGEQGVRYWCCYCELPIRFRHKATAPPSWEHVETGNRDARPARRGRRCPGAAAGEAAGGAHRERSFHVTAAPASSRRTTLIPGPADLHSPAEILAFCGRLQLEILAERVSDEAGRCAWCTRLGDPRAYPCGLRTLAV